MATLASDDFNRSDNDSLGSNWTEASGDRDISSNRAVSTSADIIPWAGTFDTANADYDVQAVVRKSGSVGASGVMGRYTDTSNYYFLDIHTFSQSMRLRKRVAGSVTTLGSYSAGQSNDVDFTIKLEMAGTTIKGYQDGTERISVTDSDLSSAGVPGLVSDAGGAQADDFIATGTVAGGVVIQDIIQPGIIPVPR